MTTGRTQIATGSDPSADDQEATAEDRPRAFIYDRHATTSTVILDIRLDRCRAYAESRGWDVAGIWLDLGDHALSHHRPQFDALCVAMDRAPGRIVCLVDGWDRLTRDASQSSVMRHRVGQTGGHCVTAEGESDAPAEKQRGRLCTPH
ncbi:MULTISPECIES: recombinase family protein [unclassified Streptomyces]|uniref:recombinase family protein n=1 Tax=unclassified Streptomyces TaxID=2593676 RepID=UPI002DDB4BF2|nr:recombinase family protein [Streptomyces sp. NBC_01750]WSB04201.1 recombinase family protein [Streptomyces sp. NBC_01794]WSD31515.1 recombinase family protein [Streptomyces sp. NBC_01750]